MNVTVRNLRRRYGKTLAVNDLSFQMRPGEIVAFVGPNGAGKTTTMRIMASLENPDTGSVHYDNVSVCDDPEDARWLFGYMPDTLPAHRDINVREYLDFFARAFGLRGAKRRQVISELEEFVSLGELRNKTLRSLSKGMKQRVSLARALIHDPQLLLLDEPAAGLDPRARIELRRLLQALARRGKTIFISSHILNELEEMADAAVIIERGTLVYAGSLSDDHVPAAAETLSGDVSIDSGGVTTHSPVPSHAAPARRVNLRAIGDPEDLLRACSETTHVRRATIDHETVMIELDRPDDETAALVLKSLLERGQQIIEFRPSRTRLEHLFMDVTRGNVQ